MGTEDLKALLVKYDLQLDPKYNEYLGRYKRKRWDSFINNENKHFCTPDAMDLLKKMLVYDHMERICPKDAMEHPYFDAIKKSGLL
jgi:casein kinase II subunit alpha